jgi:Holliday junction resolvasome RuvABC endonuclease subunit
MAKISIQSISEELDGTGWQVVSTEYKNLESELTFLCPEGHKVYNSWKRIRARRECPVCRQNKFKEQEQKVAKKKPGEVRVLALDQATHISGWSIFSNGELLRYGTFETQLADEDARDSTIKNWLINMIDNWQPDIVGIEGIQYQQNEGVTTFEKLARLQGILINCVYELKIPYQVCHTQVWRSHCGVKGKTRADKKKSMQLIVKQLFDISVSNDCADAIGIGMYVAANHFKKPVIESWE